MFRDSLERYIEDPSRKTFTAVFQEYRLLSLHIALRVTKDEQAAEDVAQEVFTDLLLRPPVHPLPVSPRVLLISLTHQRASDYVRRESLRREREHNAATERLAMLKNSSFRELEEAVESLDESLRWAIYLHFFYGLSWEDVGRIQDCSVSTVYRRLELGKRLLKLKLGAGALAALTSWSEAAKLDISSPNLDQWVKQAVAETSRGAAKSGITALLLKIAAAVLVVAVPAILFGPLLFRRSETTENSVLEPGPEPLPVAEGDPDPADQPGAGSGGAALPVQSRFLKGAVLVWDSRKPVSGAVIRKIGEEGAGEAVSGTDGSFALAGDEDSPTELMISREGFTPTRVVVPASMESSIQVLLVPAWTYRARFVDGDTMQPVQGVEVSLVINRPTPVLVATTDASGEVELAMADITIDLAKGRFQGWPRFWEISAAAYGYLNMTKFVALDELDTKGEQVQLTLYRGYEIDGVVLAPEGEPVPSARVLWSCRIPGTEMIKADSGGNRTVTDTRGRFLCTLPRAASGCVFFAAKEGRGHGFLALEDLRQRSTDTVTISLQSLHTFEGRLRDQDGRPLSTVQVHLQPPGGILGPSWRYNRLLRRHWGGNPFSAVTDRDGAFTVKGVPPGTYRVTLSEDSTPAQPVASIPTASVWIGHLQRGNEVWGCVEDQNGDPIQSFFVRALPPRGRTGTAEHERIRCLNTGEFKIPAYYTYPCRLVVGAPGYSYGYVEISEPPEIIVIRLEEGLAEQVALEPSLVLDLSCDNAALEDEEVHVILRSSANPGVTTFYVPVRRGRAELRGLSHGRYDLEVRLKGCSPVQCRDITIPCTEAIRIPLEPAG